MEDAAREYLEAGKIQDDDPDLYNNRAVALMRLGREDEAVQEFTRALALDPDETSAHVNLLAIELKRGHLEEAARHLEQAHFLTEANAHRVADAITATAAQKPTVPQPALCISPNAPANSAETEPRSRPPSTSWKGAAHARPRKLF